MSDFLSIEDRINALDTKLSEVIKLIKSTEKTGGDTGGETTTPGTKPTTGDDKPSEASDNAVSYDEMPKVVITKDNGSTFNLLTVAEVSELTDAAIVGVEAIPASLDVYGTGETGVLALENTRSYEPANRFHSGEYIDPFWSRSVADNLAISNGIELPSVNFKNEPSGVVNDGFLPSNNFVGFNSPYIRNVKWHTNANLNKLLPAQWMSNLKKNKVFWEFTPETVDTLNVLTDFNGLDNSKKIVESLGSEGVAAYWVVQNRENYNYNNTQWHLPAVGELAIVLLNLKNINNILEKLDDIQNSNINASVLKGEFWTSNESSNDNAWSINMDNGNLTANTKKESKCVRAMARVKITN